MSLSVPSDPGGNAAAPAEPRASSAAATRWGQLSHFGWPLLCLFELGLALAAFRVGSSFVHTEVPEEPAALSWPTPPSVDTKPGSETKREAPFVRSDLEEADQLIRSGRYELALPLCRASARAAVAGLRDAFLYRIALSQEGLGRWDAAVEAYRLAASHGSSPRLAAAAQLGQARVWLRMGRPAESKGLLCDLLLRSAQPGLGGLPLLAEARYFLALAVVQEAVRPERAGPLEDVPVGQLASDWPLEPALAWGQGVTTLDLSVAEAEPDRFQVQRSGSSEDFLVQVRTRSIPVFALFDQLSVQAGLQVEWTPAARIQADDHSLRVEVERMPLADLLRAVGGLLGLDCHLSGSRLVVSSEREETEQTTRRMRAARRALRAAVAAHPRHFLTPAAYLELGNLEAAAHQVNEAGSWYRRLAREWPRSSLVVEAHYNMGLLQQHAGSWAEARQAFYRVVDRAPAHELTPRAYWRIGRIHLDEGQPEQAISPLRRALATSAGSPVQAAAALNLAGAYLLTGNPQAANAILLEHQAVVRQPDYQLLAAFLDTLARYRTCSDRRRSEREAADLLTCMLHLQEDPLLGPSSLLLLGQAYHDLGMNESVIKLCEKALPRLRGALAEEISFLLAESWYASESPEQAAALYTRLAEKPGGRWRSQALMRLVQTSLASKRPRQCLSWCRKALQEKEGVDVAAVLRCMASAYEQAGEHKLAIRCLAGEIPEAGQE